MVSLASDRHTTHSFVELSSGAVAVSEDPEPSNRGVVDSVNPNISWTR